MLSLFTNLILVGCSDTGLNSLPDEPAPETNECGCPDYTNKIAELETKINGLTDQLEHVQGDMLDNDERISAVEEASTSSSSLVVSEYTVDCVADREPGAQTEFLRGYPLLWEGEVASYIGCLVANVDIADQPYSIDVSWLTDGTLTYPSDSDYRTSSGNDLRYSPNSFGVLDMNMGTYITSTGDVYASVTPLQTDWSAAPEELSSKAVPVRVVIIHDRPYTLPTYTP